MSAASCNEIEAFLSSHRAADFLHAREVLALMRDDPGRVDRCEQLIPASALVETFKQRAEFKRLCPTPKPCPPTLDDDLEALYQALLEAGIEPIRHWDIPDGNGTMYLVFEAPNSGRVLACVAGIDNRIPEGERTLNP